MAGFAVQNFLSAAVGIAVVVALIRGPRAPAPRSGRQLLVGPRPDRRAVLLPLSIVVAVILISMGAIPEPRGPHRNHHARRRDPVGARRAGRLPGAIKELGTNGGGFFNANSAHPFENPTPLSDLLEIFLLLVIPFRAARTFGVMVGDKRQGWAIFTVPWAPGGPWAGAC